MTWALILYLSFPFTPQAEPLRIDSDKRYTSVRCLELGRELVNWLMQDGVEAKFVCENHDVQEAR